MNIFENNDGGLKNMSNSPQISMWLNSKDVFDKLKTIKRNSDFYFGFGVKVYRNFDFYILEIDGEIVAYGRGNYISNLVRLVFWLINKHKEDYK